MTEETERQPEVTTEPGPAAATAAGPRLVPAQRAPVEEREERQDHPDEEKASPEQEKTSSPAPARPRKRGRGCAIITGSAIAMLVLLSAGSAFLLAQQAGTDKARPEASAKVAVRDRAADWVATQVGRTGLISCDREMCQALEERQVPAADLLVLRSGAADPLRSAVVVVTAMVKKMVGSRRLAADAPAAIASFGSGAAQISIRLIFRRGATAYAAALRREIAGGHIRTVHLARGLDVVRIEFTAPGRFGLLSSSAQ